MGGVTSLSSDFKELMTKMVTPSTSDSNQDQEFVNLMGRLGVPTSFVDERTKTAPTGQTPTKIRFNSPDETIDYNSPQGLAKGLSMYGIKDPKEQAGILAQLKAESGLKPQTENLNYSPERLLEVFPKYFKNLDEAKKTVANGEEAIANKIYGGRMGNAKDEGYKYRGRGFIQLTGKYNYKKYGKKIGVDLVKNPDLLNDPEVALKVAAAYMKDRSKNLTDAYSNTKGVAPAGWKDKVGERKALQNELLNVLLENT